MVIRDILYDMMRRAGIIFLLIGISFATVPAALASDGIPRAAASPRILWSESSETFFVDPALDKKGRSSVVATLRHTSAQGYFFVEDDWWNRQSPFEQTQSIKRLEELGAEFDMVIVPRLRRLLGSEWVPGRDNDPRVTILFLELKSEAGGYFDSLNEFPRSQTPRSNEREMLYLSASQMAGERIKSFLAHEFQHLISNNQKERLRDVSDDVWLNEARSEYAGTYLGYDDSYMHSNLSRRVTSFLAYPADPLGEWKNESQDYGSVNLFAQYLAGRFGPQIFRDMLRSPRAGIASIDDALRSEGRSETFSDVFTDWTIANAVNDPSLGSAYAYQNARLAALRVAPSGSFRVMLGIAFSFSESVKSWSPRWYTFLPGSEALSIVFRQTNPAKHFRLPYIVAYQDGSRSLREARIDNGEVTLIIPQFGTAVSSVTVIPSLQEKRSAFGESESPETFSLRASLTREVPLTLASLTPTAALTVGGIEATIRGSGFVKGMKVFFGSHVSPKVEVVDRGEMRVEIPGGETGDVSLRVERPDGTSLTFQRPFRYNEMLPSGTLIRARGDYRVYVVQGRYRRHIPSPRIFDIYGHLSFEKVVIVSPDIRDEYEEVSLIRAVRDKKVYEVGRDGLTRHWLDMTASQFVASGRDWGMVFLVDPRERDFYKTSQPIHAL